MSSYLFQYVSLSTTAVSDLCLYPPISLPRQRSYVVVDRFLVTEVLASRGFARLTGPPSKSFRQRKCMFFCLFVFMMNKANVVEFLLRVCVLTYLLQNWFTFCHSLISFGMQCDTCKERNYAKNRTSNAKNRAIDTKILATSQGRLVWELDNSSFCCFCSDLFVRSSPVPT